MNNNFFKFYIITFYNFTNLQACIKYSKIGLVYYYCYSAYPNSIAIFKRGWLENVYDPELGNSPHVFVTYLLL